MAGLVKQAEDSFKQKVAAQHYSVTTLKLLITIWVLGLLFITWILVDNPVLLIAILAYEVLP